MDDRRYLQSLINEGEHQQQDFKYRVSDAQKLAKSVSAFANTDGGRLLIGVRDDGHMSGVRDEEEIYMMHQAAYRYCRPEASIKFDTFHVSPSDTHDGSRGLRTIVVATVSPSEKRPICAVSDDGKQRAYILIDALHDQRLTLNQLVRRSTLPRQKVITLLARLIRFHVAQWEYADQQFLFSLI